MKQRHCLATRVRAMLVAQNGNSGNADLSRLIEGGCDCAQRNTCTLGSACESIHLSFAPSRPALLDIALQ
ncbi:hypothetical protein [Paramagnetospirillum kuznetsovii]|uniref:hypothetical protein n=1 Tax=Paramagnetospirillum kuznetsovii TaxID=2053833 RepID=UPI0011BFE2F9|nr:hypothetical protein [Paramagnetospirillum kuznetsovii]